MFAAATEDSRPVLTGVHFAIADREIRLAAADGFRLSVHTLTLDQDGEERSVIVPARSLGELGRLLQEVEGAVTLTFNAAGTQVECDLGHAKLVAQLLQGTFPNYAQLIPKETTTRTEVAVQELARETRIASIFARDGSGIVRLIGTPSSTGPGPLQINARAEEVGDNEGEIDAVIDGD